jgi:hypothetical protein
VSPGHKKQVVEAAVRGGVCSGRGGCRVLGLSRSGYWFKAGRRSSRQQELVKRMHQLSTEEPRWGYRRIAQALKDEGWNVGRRQIRRLRRQEGLRVPPFFKHQLALPERMLAEADCLKNTARPRTGCSVYRSTPAYRSGRYECCLIRIQ